jgi:two-component system, LuxR family, sensor kinase FixL
MTDETSNRVEREFEPSAARADAAAKAGPRASRLPAWMAPERLGDLAFEYGAIMVGGALSFVLAQMLLEVAVPGEVFLVFTPLVVAASFLSGARAGVLATLLGAWAGATLTPRGDPRFDALGVIFVAVGLVSSAGGEWAVRARRRGARAARELSEREAHMRSIFDTAPEGMIVIDEEGIIQTYSAAAERIFGWAGPDVLGRNVSMLMPAPQRGEHDGYLRRYLETGAKRIIGVGRIVSGERKDGSAFPIELNVGEISTPRGRFFTGFVRDLTERQRTEARLQELQGELVHTSRLSAMGEMASALAHELNQPLSANANYLSAARRMLEQGDRNDQRLQEAIVKAGEQSLRAGEIIRRLRNFLARGEGERKPEPLAKLVHEACALALVGAGDENVSICYELQLEDDVLVDRVQVQQVIVNLIRNALDAMRAQDRPRKLCIKSAADEDGMAVVSVIDSGPGLDPEAAKRLFQPFVTTKAQGMGVGLSISRNIVEAHGGRIWTEPNPQGGTIFRFTLRRARRGAASEGDE